MKLVGFKFVRTQEEFEQWQLDNPDFKVHALQPFMQGMDLAADNTTYGQSSHQGKTQIIIFVTYTYLQDDAQDNL